MAQQKQESGPIAGVVKWATAPDGVKIEYEVLGTGPPIVLLHGGFVGRSAFSRQRALAERYRLILPSSRGHDGTDGTLPSNYGFDTSEVDDVRVVLDAEGIERTHLLGHSSGGATAFAFDRRFPQRVDQLILIEPTLLSLLPAAMHQMWTKHFAAIIDLAEREGDAAGLRATLEWAGGEAWARLDENTKSSRLQALANLAHLTRPHGRGLLNLGVTDLDVRSLRPTTLLIYGTASYDFELFIAQRFRDLRPDLQLIVIEGAGHNLHRERPDIVNPAIERFLAS